MSSREIKFRGYSYKEGKWLYGNLIEKDDPQKEAPTPWVRLIHNKALDAELVTFESVGQFSGMKDKNDNDIYEGDILKYDLPGEESDDDTEYVEAVEFNDACFNVEAAPLSAAVDWGCEIIGNIYQNPELLKP